MGIKEHTLKMVLKPFLHLSNQQMDGDVYEDLRSHFTLLCGTEMDSCLSTHKQYSKIWDSLVKVSV